MVPVTVMMGHVSNLCVYLIPELHRLLEKDR